MFRKRIKTAVEESLVEAGVDLHGKLGRTLLFRLFEHGYSDYNVHITRSAGSGFIIRGAGWRQGIGVARVGRVPIGCWGIVVWDGLRGRYVQTDLIYSKTNIFGELVTDV